MHQIYDSEVCKRVPMLAFFTSPNLAYKCTIRPDMRSDPQHPNPLKQEIADFDVDKSVPQTIRASVYIKEKLARK